MPGLVEIGSLILVKKIFKDFVKVISLFCNFLSMEKGRAIHLYKLEFYSRNDALCQVG